ncbi:ribonuclease HII [Eudoraea adriatica]|uniref:ribonuclease HII n=1 Tax=Eudoraea adriatica TaxID=446681 RepID=UPI00035EDEF4|nr:ribonuclease HII [Eudoraea adriatica]
MLKYYRKNEFEAGTDEAGRGCLAGPVTAAAVILPSSFTEKSLNDSKKLSETIRNRLRPLIELRALSFSVAHIQTDVIDNINILNASILAMHKAINTLSSKPSFIIVDGNRFKPINEIPYECIIKGDSKFQSIAAASILAKTHRDAYMEKIHEEFPMYNWKQNKGYGTREHREAIMKYGITKYHRRSFKLKPDQLKLNL